MKVTSPVPPPQVQICTQSYIYIPQYSKANFPNLLMSALLFFMPDFILTLILNPARKKQARLEGLCKIIKWSFVHMIRYGMYWMNEILAYVFSFSQQEDKNDVVFLQEVWLKKDYDTLRKCTMTRFYASPFDKECSRLNKARNQKAPQFEIMTE